MFCRALDGLEATRSAVRTQRVWGLIHGLVCFCPVEIAGFLSGNGILILLFADVLDGVGGHCPPSSSGCPGHVSEMGTKI